MAFVDLEKAYDSVSREKLWKVLDEYGVKGKLQAQVGTGVAANSTSTGVHLVHGCQDSGVPSWGSCILTTVSAMWHQDTYCYMYVHIVY